MKLKTIVGLGFAVLFDLALGLLCARVLGVVMNHTVSLFGYCVAMFFALIPDFDVLMQSAKENKITGTHKNMMHYPIAIVTGVMLIVWLCTLWLSTSDALFWSILSGLCVLGHLVHDTLEESPGIAWLAPISLTKYRLRIRGGRLAFKMTQEELEYQNKITMEQWLEREYLRPTFNLVLGLMFFSAITTHIICTNPPLF